MAKKIILYSIIIICLSSIVLAVPIGCTESDGGRNYTRAGNVTFSRDGNSYCVFADTCSGNILREFYCVADTIRYINTDCGNSGCSNGRCISTVSQNTAKFIVLEALLYNNMPDLSIYGLKKHHIIYAGYFWPSGTDFNPPSVPQPNQEFTRKAARDANGKSYENLVTLDIEHWQVYPWNDITLRDQNIKNYRQETAWIRSEVPQLKIGYFGLPHREMKYSSWSLAGGFYDPYADTSTLSYWRAGNDYIQSILDETDALFPEFYTYTNDSIVWIKFAKATVAESKRVSKEKPVYPYIWPQYFNNHIQGRAQYNEFMNYTFWKIQLQTLKDAGADGVVIWGGYQLEWDPDAEWWRATKDFIKENNLD